MVLARTLGVLPLILLLALQSAEAQSTFQPINAFNNYQLDRMDIGGDQPNISTALKPVSRLDLFQGTKRNEETFTSKFLKTELFEYPLYDTALDHQMVIAVYRSPWYKFKKRIYATEAALYSQKMRDLTLAINPVLGISGGRDFESEASTFQNTRGVEVRGMIDNKLGFYSLLTENQFRFPNFYNQTIDSTGVIPGNGFHKKFGSNARDFFLAKGYLTFSPIKHLAMQFGHDQNFIGNGYRSLILSDFSSPNLFLKINTKIWRFHYQNLFSQLTDFQFQSGNGGGVKPKYFVNHYLGIKLFKNLDIGFFESVIYDRGDSSSKGNFEINYMNPVIFYRAIEQNLNSSDNVIVGTDWKWNFLKHFSFYGQFVLDEFVKNELIKRTGWWANKYGLQSGLKYIDAFGVKRLHLQAEYNLVRPYTYTHFKKSQNYTNYNQALAHPFGSNFKEILFVGRYQPSYKLFAELGYIHVKKGLDSSSMAMRFGGNILDDYNKRPMEKGNKIGQGVSTSYAILFVNLSYMVYHNLWLEARYTYRKAQSDLSVFNSNTSWLQLGIRMNLSARNYDF